MEIQEILDQNFRGNIYILQKDKVLYEREWGFADLPNEIPNTIETKFASASAGKVFIAVGILQLVERGRIKLDDTLGMLFDISLNNIDKDVTVKQLLNHTSGVPDYFDENTMEEYEELWVDYPNYKIRHNSDLLPLFINKPMMYPKGEKFQYNNSGYVLLAMIIEKVTGMYFDQYLKKNIFDVCGMESTRYYELDKLPAQCANSYIYCADTDDYRTNIFSVDAKGTGAGGAFITVEDIVRFWNNLLEGNLISEALVSEMLSKQSGDGIDAEEGYYGYGMWIIDNPNGRDYAYFQGCDPGISFISEYNPNNGLISVLVSNYGDNVWREMRKIRDVFYKLEKDGQFQYLLFDLDGTLTDPKIGITSCVQHALRKFGVEEPDLNKLEPFIGPPLADSFQEFYGFDEKKAAEAIGYYRERFSTIGLFENEIYPGVAKMLAHLKQAGKTLAVASSKPTVFVQKILVHFNIECYFDVIVGSELDGTRARKEEVIEEALRQLRQVAEIEDNDGIVMIGDRKFDIQGAKLSNLVSVGVTFGYALPGELEEAGADYIVDTVEELEELLNG